MSGCFPSVFVRPETHPGDPVTAENTDTIATDDLSVSLEPVTARARAERLLLRIADHGEQLFDNVTDPLDIPDYLLESLVQAGKALVRLAELDAQQPPSVELLLDGTGDLWVLTGDDQFECQTSHCEPQTLEQIRAEFGVRRQFTAAPPADR